MCLTFAFLRTQLIISRESKKKMRNGHEMGFDPYTTHSNLTSEPSSTPSSTPSDWGLVSLVPWKFSARVESIISLGAPMLLALFFRKTPFPEKKVKSSQEETTQKIKRKNMKITALYPFSRAHQKHQDPLFLKLPLSRRSKLLPPTVFCLWSFSPNSMTTVCFSPKLT